MKSKKIKFWARVGTQTWWYAKICKAAANLQYQPSESGVSIMASVETIMFIVFALICTEAIVRLIGYFAELIEELNEEV